MSDDPDRQIQQKIFDMLVEKGLPEDVAATVVSNIGRMDLRDLWKKLDSEHREHKDPYGWRHSCGESFYQFDSPGDPCPSCGVSGGDDEEGSGWTWFDEDDETHEKRSRLIGINKLLKISGK